jgi:hypothetical protein
MNSKTCKTAPKTSQSFVESDVFSLRTSFSVSQGLSGHRSPASATASSSKWLPADKYPHLTGRPLAFELDCPDYSLSLKPFESKKLFRKPSISSAQTRNILMFSDRFYAGASRINSMKLNQRSNQDQLIPSHLGFHNANNHFVEEPWESPVVLESNDSLFAAEHFCTGAVEQARSVSEFWRRRKKTLTVGGMPSDKTGLLAEPTRLKNIVPPRLYPLQHKSVKGIRPLKDESSTLVDETENCINVQTEDVLFLRDTLTSSGLHPGSCSDEGVHPSFETEKICESQSSAFKLETVISNDESPKPLGIFIAAPRVESSLTKHSTQNFTPRRINTPELKQSSSFSEPLKAILKGAYDRRAADAMFCQLYLNEHVKQFENSKIAQLAVPESMQHFINDDSTSHDKPCSKHEKLAISKPTLVVQAFADKMGRPPAKPNMAREHIKLQKESIKAYQLASIPRHKRLEWSALTPEEAKQKQKAMDDKLVQDLNMPQGCWEVASWFR